MGVITLPHEESYTVNFHLQRLSQVFGSVPNGNKKQIDSFSWNVFLFNCLHFLNSPMTLAL